MKIIAISFAFLLFSCSSVPSKTKYFNTVCESKTNVALDGIDSFNSIVRVDIFDNDLGIDIIKNDTICLTKRYTIKNDTIMAFWRSIEEYTYRLLVPELNIELYKIKIYPNESIISEGNDNTFWQVKEQKNNGFKSAISSEVVFVDSTVILRSRSLKIQTTMSFTGLRKTIISEMKDLHFLSLMTNASMTV